MRRWNEIEKVASFVELATLIAYCSDKLFAKSKWIVYQRKVVVPIKTTKLVTTLFLKNPSVYKTFQSIDYLIAFNHVHYAETLKIKFVRCAWFLLLFFFFTTQLFFSAVMKNLKFIKFFFFTAKSDVEFLKFPLHLTLSAQRTSFFFFFTINGKNFFTPKPYKIHHRILPHRANAKVYFFQMAESATTLHHPTML